MLFRIYTRQPAQEWDGRTTGTRTRTMIQIEFKCQYKCRRTGWMNGYNESGMRDESPSREKFYLFKTSSVCCSSEWAYPIFISLTLIRFEERDSHGWYFVVLLRRVADLFKCVFKGLTKSRPIYRGDIHLLNWRLYRVELRFNCYHHHHRPLILILSISYHSIYYKLFSRTKTTRTWAYDE